MDRIPKFIIYINLSKSSNFIVNTNNSLVGLIINIILFTTILYCLQSLLYIYILLRIKTCFGCHTCCTYSFRFKVKTQKGKIRKENELLRPSHYVSQFVLVPCYSTSGLYQSMLVLCWSVLNLCCPTQPSRYQLG